MNWLSLKAPPSATTPTAVPPPALSQSFEARSIPSMEVGCNKAGVKRKQVFGKMQQQCILDSSTLLEPALEERLRVLGELLSDSSLQLRIVCV
eukprot:2581613-Amphidinium_carterae.1